MAVAGAKRRLVTRTQVETFLLPLGLTVALIVTSELLGLLHVRRVLVALLLLGVVAALLAVSLYLGFLGIREHEQDALYRVMSSVAFAPKGTSGVLTQAEVIGLEATAREVWIYAYDLAWEGSDSPFTRVVSENIRRGVPYRYLVPDEPDVLLRVEEMIHYMHRTGADLGLLQVRASRRERLITQFGVSVFNPTIMGRDVGLADGPDPIVTFYPHQIEFAPGGDASSSTPFLSVRGQGTRRIQEAFETYWREARQVERLQL